MIAKYFERIGDHAKIILDESREMKNKGIKFSHDAIDEFRKVYEIIEKLFDLSIKAFDNNTHKGIEDHSTFLEQFKTMEKDYIQNEIINHKIFKNDKFGEELFNFEMAKEIQKIKTLP